MTTDALQGISFQKLTATDALDLAILAEQEAHERYLLLARQVGGRYAGDAADVFTVMATHEAKHGAHLAERRLRLFGKAPRTVTRDMLYQVEAPDLGSPRVFMSARQAFEVAAASEQKAREFFEEALRSTLDPEVRGLFAELRDEEAQHEAFVRARLAALPPGPDLEDGDADEPGSDPAD